MSQSKAQLVDDVKPSLAIGYSTSNSAVTAESGVQLQLHSNEHAQLKLSADRGNHGSESYEARVKFAIDGNIEQSAIRLGNYGNYWSGGTNNDNALILSVNTDSTFGGIVFETGQSDVSSGELWNRDVVRERVRIANSGLEILGGIEGSGATQVRHRVLLSSTMGLNTGDSNNASANTVGLNVGGTAYLKVPIGTTAQRPAAGTAGMLRFNSTLGKLEQHDGTTWTAITSPPVVNAISYPGSQTAFDPAGGETITVSGTNFSSVPSVKLIAPGGTEFEALSETFVSATSFTFVTPDVSSTGAGDYDLRVENPDGGVTLKADFITANGLPNFTSHSAGATVIDGDEGATVSVTIVASETDGGTVTYSINSGSLPTGVTLNTSTGVISGTLPTVSADTNFNFTIRATDNENQTSDRSFTITVRDVYTMSGSAEFGGS